MANQKEMINAIRKYGVADGRVLAAIGEVDRAEFVPEELRSEAYEDRPLPIGGGQTISQPYTVARMIELLIERSTSSVQRLEKVLEIGTGSGWQTAILSRLFDKVFSVEIIPDLVRRAEFEIRNLKFENVRIKTGDGKEGWTEYAPYDAIICGADAQEIPTAWLEQLAVGGRIVCPVKGEMTRITKILNPPISLKLRGVSKKYFKTERFESYVFVPLV